MSSGNSDGLLEIDVWDWSGDFEMVYCEALVYCVLLRGVGGDPPPPQKCISSKCFLGAGSSPTHPPTHKKLKYPWY